MKNPFHFRPVRFQLIQIHAGRGWARLLLMLLAGLLLLLTGVNATPAMAAADPVLRTELLGQFGGQNFSAAISGHYLYLNEGAMLRILDISNPVAPVETGRAPLHVNGVYKIAIADGMAYVVSYDYTYRTNPNIGYLDIIDVRDPAAPYRRSSLILPGYPMGVAVEGNLVCVAAGTLYLIDVSDLDRPVVTKTWPTNMNYDVEMRNGLAYLSEYQQFRILDVHDPYNPTQRGIIQTSDSFISICLAGDLALLGAYHTLCLMNISDPGNPTLISRVMNGNGYIRRAVMTGQKAYMVDSVDGLFIYDISDPVTPQRESVRSMPALGAYDLAMTGHTAFVPYNNGYQILDVSNPSSTTLLADNKRSTPLIKFSDVASTGSLACLFCYNQLTTLDLKNPANPRPLGSLSLPYSGTITPKRMALTGSLGLIAAGSLGVQVIDLSRPTTPTLLTSYKTPGYAYQVAAEGSQAYVADGSLLILDVSDPTSFTLRRQVAEAGDARCVALAGGRAYVANATGLQILDIHDPDRTSALGSLAFDGWGKFVAVDGPTAYVLMDGSSSSQRAVYVVDIHDPTAPVQLARIGLTQSTDKIDAGQGLLYIMSTSRLTVYDMRDPRSPKLLGEMRSSYGLAANHDLIFTYDYDGSFALRQALLPVQVLSPNGGQTLRGGDALTVHWKTDLLVAGTAVRLELWNNNKRVAILGDGWNPLGEGETSVLVPLLPEGSDYRLRAASSWAPELYDEADAPFTILANPNAAVEAGEWTLYQ